MTLRHVHSVALSSLIVLSAAFAGGVAAAQSGTKPKPPTVSKAIIKQAQAAQAAIKAEKWADCIAALAATDAAPDKTPYDDYAVSELRTVCAARSNDLAAAEVSLARGLEVGEANGFVDEENRKLKLRRAAQAEPTNRDVRLLTAQSLYLVPDNAGVAAFVEPWVTELEQRKETPPDLALNLWASACVRMKDDKCVRRAVEKQVAYAPSEEAWGNLFLLTMRDAPPDQNLNVLRFAYEVGALKTGDDIAEYASLAMEKGYPGEAQSVLETAVAAGKFGGPGKTTPGAANLLQQSKAAAAPDRASLARQAKEAAAQKTGVAEVRLGQAYLSYGQPAEAVASIERGLAKGGVKAVDEANLTLGIARLKAGDKAGAVTAFDAVKDPFMGRLAGYWKLRAR
jgi:tetratricopeptide (TPR) repeat protein